MTTPATTSAWWVRRWQNFLKQIGLAPTPDNGALRGCRVKRLEVLPGMVQAQVQDRELGAAAVQISIPVLDDSQWKFITDALGARRSLRRNCWPGICHRKSKMCLRRPGQLCCRVATAN
ncbi:MAG: hypothetical protein IPK16_21795 [Anaerolineales bacterium]|nr:hypothetical protein [Anaerolineales bacterium]